MLLPARQRDTQVLVIGDIEIFQDEYGRYNLNTLHRASPLSQKRGKAPGEWLKNKQTQELIEELKSREGNSPREAADWCLLRVTLRSH
jgi:hypothetical protein